MYNGFKDAFEEKFLFQMSCKSCDYKSKKVNTTEILFKNARADGVVIKKEEVTIYIQKDRKNHKALDYTFICPNCGGTSFSLAGDEVNHNDKDLTTSKHYLEDDDLEEKPSKVTKSKRYDYNEDDENENENDSDVPEGFHIEEVEEDDEDLEDFDDEE